MHKEETKLHLQKQKSKENKLDSESSVPTKDIPILALNDKQEVEPEEKKAAVDKDEVSEEEEEAREKGGIKKETFFAYFRAMGKWNLGFFLLGNFLMEGSMMLIDFWLRDEVSPSSTFFNNINQLFTSFSSTFLFFIYLTIGLTSFRGIFYCICALLGGKRLFQQLNKSIVFAKMKFFDKNPVGRIINRISDDILGVDDYLPWAFHVLMETFAYGVGYPLGIVIQFPWLIIFVLIAVYFIYLIQKIYRISNREIKRLNSVNSGKVLTLISESCSGLAIVRSFRQEGFMVKEYLSKLSDSMNTYLLSQIIQIWMTIRLLLISNIIFGAVALSSSIIIIAGIDMNFNTMAMCLTYSMLLSSKFCDLMYFYCTVESNMVSVERIRQYFTNPQEKLEELVDTILEKKNSIQTSFIQPSETSSEFSVEFDNVCITYDDLEGKEDISIDSKEVKYALKNVSLKIKKGEKIAFCGRTGSGKTSIFNALFAMYPVQFGDIKVHGKSISQFTMEKLRNQMAIIPQFGFLYNATLLQNLDPASLVPREKVTQIVKATNLRIRENQDSKSDEDIESEQEQESSQEIQVGQQQQQQYKQDKSKENDSDDLDLEIENGGTNLSNGEKQIVNFLRILLRETDIICLDEATSNMDPKTDAELHRQIFEFSSNKTLLVITHRLENIDQFDRIVVLDKGKIVECGPVAELRKIEGGFFNKLNQ